jgi:acetylornithine deacetylase
MKGGLAAACFALKALRQTNAPIEGDVWLQCVTDEETNGMGTVAMLRSAPPADAAICPEPTGLDAWTSCRGVLYGRVTIHGRGGHAEGHQHDWRAGGGVSAIEKLRPVLDAIERINADWRQRADKTHPVLARPRIVPTVVRGGEFVANFPAVCVLEVDVTYLPTDADADGFGHRVRAEVEREVAAFVREDPWLHDNPSDWEWFADYPPYEAADVEGLCSVLEDAAAMLGRQMRRRGLNSWHDAASIGARGGIPAVSFGPGDPRLAHKPDEAIAVADLVLGAKALARVMLQWCNSEPSVVR